MASHLYGRYQPTPGTILKKSLTASPVNTDDEAVTKDVPEVKAAKSAESKWSLKPAKGNSPQLKLPPSPTASFPPSPADVPSHETGHEELMARIRELFSDALPRTNDEAILDLSRILGYEDTSAGIADILGVDIRTAIRRGILEKTAGRLTLRFRNITDYPRDFLQDMLVAAIGTTWTEREDAIRATARHLGYRRTRSSITESLKSAINGAIRRGMLEYEGTRIRKAR